MADFAAFHKDFEENYLLIASSYALYQVDCQSDDLWETYLKAFPAGTNEVFRERREHDCSCCRTFIRNYGNLVYVENNQIKTIWDFETIEPYQTVVKALNDYLSKFRIKHKFVPTEKT